MLFISINVGRALQSSSSFEVLRTLAHTDRLRVEAIVEAKRVARRAVVVMDQIGGCELERLGLPVVQAGQRKRYGVLSCRKNSLHLHRQHSLHHRQHSSLWKEAPQQTPSRRTLIALLTCRLRPRTGSAQTRRHAAASTGAPTIQT